MNPIYVHNYKIEAHNIDRYNRLRPSAILYIAQEMGGIHSALMNLDYDTLAQQRLFWAVTRHRVQITRMPMVDETIRVETWPLPATRVAFPRSVIAYDEQGNECFRVMSLWVLMNMDTRQMILPGKSGISVLGTLRGNELPVPNGLILRKAGTVSTRTVRFSDLDRNGHMNNTRCMEWIDDLLPSAFHRDHIVKEFVVCYLAEAREEQELTLNCEFIDDTTLQVDSTAGEGDNMHRVFSAKLMY